MELIALTDAGSGITLAQHLYPSTEEPENYNWVVRAQLPSGEWADSEMWLVDATYTREYLERSDPEQHGPSYWNSVGTNGHTVCFDTDEHVEIDGTLYLIEWRDYSGTGEVA